MTKAECMSLMVLYIVGHRDDAEDIYNSLAGRDPNEMFDTILWLTSRVNGKHEDVSMLVSNVNINEWANNIMENHNE